MTHSPVIRPRAWTAVVNPAAGKGRTRKLLPQLTESLTGALGDVEIHVTTDAGDVLRRARAAYAAGRTVVACGGDGTVNALAGVNAIKLDGKGGTHDLVFDDDKVPGFQLDVNGDGTSEELKLDLKPGKYTYYCSIPGHRASMEGTLTVT